MGRGQLFRYIAVDEHHQHQQARKPGRPAPGHEHGVVQTRDAEEPASLLSSLSQKA